MHSLVYPAIPLALGGIAPNPQGLNTSQLTRMPLKYHLTALGNFDFCTVYQRFMLVGGPCNFLPQNSRGVFEGSSSQIRNCLYFTVDMGLHGYDNGKELLPAGRWLSQGPPDEQRLMNLKILPHPSFILNNPKCYGLVESFTFFFGP